MTNQPTRTAPSRTPTRSLRIKVAATLLFLVTGLVSGLSLLAQTVLTERFSILEDREAKLNVERVRNAMEQTTAFLETKVQDWAYWDDAYTFVQDGNKGFRESNLSDNALPNLKINLLVYANEKKEIIAALQHDLDKGEVMKLTPAIDKVLNSGLLEFENLADANSAIIDLPEGPLLAVAKAVITSGQQGPIKGGLIFGQFIKPGSTAKKESEY